MIFIKYLILHKETDFIDKNEYMLRDFAPNSGATAILLIRFTWATQRLRLSRCIAINDCG